MLHRDSIHLVYHTLEQVVVGYALGCLFGLFWFNLSTPVMDRVVHSSWFPVLSEWFMVRDCRSVVNLPEQEYQLVLRLSSGNSKSSSKSTKKER